MYRPREEQQSTLYAKNDPQWPTLSSSAMREAMSKLSFGEGDDAVNGDAFGTDGEIKLLVDKMFDSSKFHNLTKVDLLKTHRVAGEMIRDRQIGWRIPVRQALADGFALVADYHQDYQSERWVLHDALAGGYYVESLTGEHLAPFIRSLGASGKISLSDHGKDKESEARAQQWKSDERARLIQSITQGKNAFQIFSKAHGQPRTFPASDLDNLSLEQLREIDAAATELRRARGLSREEQASELRQRATEARGYEVFRPGDSTSLESDNLPEGPTSVATDRGVGSVPIAESTKQLWIDPGTNAY